MEDFVPIIKKEKEIKKDKIEHNYVDNIEEEGLINSYYKSTVGTKKLKLAIRKTQKRKIGVNKEIKKKRNAVKSYQNREIFLRKLRGILNGEFTKLDKRYEELKVFDTSIYETMSKNSLQEIKENENEKIKGNDNVEEDLFGDFLLNENIGIESTVLNNIKLDTNLELLIDKREFEKEFIDNEIETNKIIGNTNNLDLLEKLHRLQIEIDDRQRKLAQVFNLTTQYVSKEETNAKKINSIGENLKLSVDRFTDDVLHYVNSNIMDEQKYHEMYISSKIVNQDLYKENENPKKIKTTLFRNHKENNNLNTSREANHNELKKIVDTYQKKRSGVRNIKTQIKTERDEKI